MSRRGARIASFSVASVAGSRSVGMSSAHRCHSMSRCSAVGSLATAHASMNSARVPARKMGPRAMRATASCAPFALASFHNCAATVSSPARTKSRMAVAHDSRVTVGSAPFSFSSAARADVRTSTSPASRGGAGSLPGNMASVFGAGTVISGSPIVAIRQTCGIGSLGHCRPATKNGVSAASRCITVAGGTNAVKYGSCTEPT